MFVVKIRKRPRGTLLIILSFIRSPSHSFIPPRHSAQPTPGPQCGQAWAARPQCCGGGDLSVWYPLSLEPEAALGGFRSCWGWRQAVQEAAQAPGVVPTMACPSLCLAGPGLQLGEGLLPSFWLFWLLAAS